MSDKKYHILYSELTSGPFGQIGYLSKDKFYDLYSSDGHTYCFPSGQYVDLECRENGFIKDPNFTSEDTSRALRNYFMNGKFFNSGNISYNLEEMETWILTYLDYLNDSDLKKCLDYLKETSETI